MFHSRSHTPELLDQPNIPFADIRQNMKELDTINSLLGGHKITLKGLELLMKHHRADQPVHIAEIGCGDGNNLRVIQQWALGRNIAVCLTGIDYNSVCIDYARQIKANENMTFICADYRTVDLAVQPQIIFSSLFCHHFSDSDLVAQLRWMQQNSSLGFFINDLHRHPVAYHGIRMLAGLFSKSYLIKNDAPLSVLRGFSKREWQHLLKLANIAAQVRWMWAFRWLIVCSL